MADPNTVPPPDPQVHPSRRRFGRKWFVLALILLLGAWAVVMFYRMEIRAYVWAYRLTRTQVREERNYYLRCLSAVGDKSLGAAKWLTGNSRPDMREAGIAVLESCKDPEVDGLLLGLLSDQNDDVADAAARALAQRSAALGYLPKLREMLNRGDDAGRHAAVAIQRIPGQEPETVLIEALARADHPDLRAQIIDSLGMRGSNAAVTAIVPMIEDGRTVQRLPFSQRSALRAFAQSSGEFQARGMDPQSIMQAMERPPTVSEVAIRSLQIIAGSSALPASTAPAENLKALREQWETWSRSPKPRPTTRPRPPAPPQTRTATRASR